MSVSRRKLLKKAAATVAGVAVSASTLAAQDKGRSRANNKVPKRRILTDKAPKPVGPYSQGIIAGNTIYVAGQIATNPRSGRIESDKFDEQAVQVLENLKVIVEAAGATLDDVVKVNVYLTDLANFAKMNEIYRRYFTEPYPARATVGAPLVSTALIEIDCVVVK